MFIPIYLNSSLIYYFLEVINMSNIIKATMAVVVMLVIAIIIGTVEDGLTFTQSLTSTIGGYLEPLAILSTLGLIGYMAYSKVNG